MRIIADDPELERHLARLHDLIVSNGGFIHDEFTIDARGGNLTVLAPRSVPERLQIISVPEALLLPIDGFGLHLEGDDICLGTPAEKITSLQIELMEEMATVYNLCGKIKFHRETSPTQLFLERPDVYERLVFEAQLRGRQKEMKEDFFLHDFIHTRQFGLGGDKKEDRCSVLMPIVDFINHHQSAMGFIFNNETLSVNRRSPIESSDECFVCYSRMDAQIAYFNYGFLDAEATFAISAPMKIDLPGLVEIDVKRTPGAKRKNPVPQNMKDLARFVPSMSVGTALKQAAVSILIIPDCKTPRALRRILMMVLISFVRHLPPDEVTKALHEAERQVIEANRNHYKGMQDYIATLSLPEHLQVIVDDAGKMAEHQLKIISDYEFNIAQLDQ